MTSEEYGKSQDRTADEIYGFKPGISEMTDKTENISIGKSKEDYLEAIFIQINRNGACRSTDVAAQLGFSKPSASIALKKLEDEGYIERYDGRILLTEKGKEIARKTYDKHSFFKQWLIMAGVDDKVAEEEACQMEHIISEDSFDKITAYLKKLDNRFC